MFTGSTKLQLSVVEKMCRIQNAVWTVAYGAVSNKAGAVWASEDTPALQCDYSLLTSPPSADAERRGLPSRVCRQIVCLFFFVSEHIPPPTSNSVDMRSLVQRQAVSVV